MTQTVAIIPARGGSKRIPRKNLKYIAGKPLIAHTILAACQAGKLSGVFVSTEDEEIASVAKDFGAELIQRPSELAADDSSSEDVVRHALQSIMSRGGRPDHFCLLQPTSPLRTARHIDDAISAYLKANCRPLISVTNAQGNINKLLKGVASGVRPVFGLREFSAKATDVPGSRYIPNGAIYLVRVMEFMETGSLYEEVMTPYIMPREASIDIDHPEDLQVAEILLNSIANV